MDKFEERSNQMSPVGMDVILAISEEVGKKSVDRPEDYTGTDGLRYCGVCGKAKETYLPDVKKITFTEEEDGTMKPVGEIPLTDIIVNSLCDCDRKRDEELEKAQKLYELQSKCFPLIKLPSMIKKTFANDDHKGDPKPMQRAKTYADNFDAMLRENVSLIFYGTPGTGKSYATACIANAIIEQGYSCYMTSFPAIIRQIYNVENKDQYIQNLCAVDLLIIDDLFKEHKNEYALSIVWQVIDARCTLELPMVLSTNTGKDNLRKYSGKDEGMDATLDSIKSRLSEAWLVAYNGFDRRKRKSAEKHRNLKEILGFDGDE
ncbi:MAG: ATP-binding protein, partial [Oscillospiraceae bacterium]|nr:ATP-binding protein [Oscillospiraceae bacterium]